MLPYYLLIIFGSFYVVDGIIGIVGNGLMIMCFFENLKFDSSCHILITLLCLANLVHIAGEFVFTAQILGNLTTPQYTCYYMMIIPIVGGAAGSPLILALGIDRLMAVAIPTMYRKIQADKLPYLVIQMIFPIAYTFVILIMGYRGRVQDEDFLVQCPLPMALFGTTYDFHSSATTLINALIVIIYILIYFLLKKFPASARSKTIFNSLGLTVLFVLAGWAGTVALNIFNFSLVTNEFAFEVIQLYSGIPFLFSLSSTLFVFYSVNSEYRKTINTLLSSVGIQIRDDNSWTEPETASSPFV